MEGQVIIAFFKDMLNQITSNGKVRKQNHTYNATIKIFQIDLIMTKVRVIKSSYLKDLQHNSSMYFKGSKFLTSVNPRL